MLLRPRAHDAALARTIDDLDPFDVSAVLTLLLILLYGGSDWYIDVPVSLVVIAGLVFSGLRRRPVLWLCAFAVLFAGNVYNWDSADNHKYLIAYWCLGLGLSLLSTDPARALQANARLLVGCTFLFAALWKTISPDYLNGTFFHFSLLFDDRFVHVARLFGGQIEPLERMNEVAQRALVSYDSALQAVDLRYSRGVATLAAVFTWWGFLVEWCVAVCFLLPDRVALPRLRDAALLVFIGTTYLIAPVIGFGWVLALMGVAQALPERRVSAILYLLSILLMQVYRVPWKALLP